MPKGSCIYAVIENADFGGVQVFDVNKNGSLTAKARLDTEDVYSTYISAEKRETGFLSLIMGRRPVRFIDMKRKNWFKKVCLERKKQKKPYPLRCIDTGGGLCVSSGCRNR